MCSELQSARRRSASVAKDSPRPARRRHPILFRYRSANDVGHRRVLRRDMSSIPHARRRGTSAAIARLDMRVALGTNRFRRRDKGGKGYGLDSNYRRRWHPRLARQHRHAHGRPAGYPPQHRRRHRRRASRRPASRPSDRRRSDHVGRVSTSGRFSSRSSARSCSSRSSISFAADRCGCPPHRPRLNRPPEEPKASPGRPFLVARLAECTPGRFRCERSSAPSSCPWTG